jgi:hypothetical protein
MLRVEAQWVARPGGGLYRFNARAGESESLTVFHQTPHFQNREDDTSAKRGNRKH